MQFDFSSSSLHTMLRQSKDFREQFIGRVESLTDDLSSMKRERDDYMEASESARNRVTQLANDNRDLHAYTSRLADENARKQDFIRNLEAQVRTLEDFKKNVQQLTGSDTVPNDRPQSGSPYFGLSHAERNGGISCMTRGGKSNKIAMIKELRTYVSRVRNYGAGEYYGLADAKAFVEDMSNLRAAFGSAF